MMQRSAFLAGIAAASLSAKALAQDEFDPASSSSVQALRVLLGRGSAIPNPGGGFTYDGRAYRGTFAQLADGSVVNTISLEEYIYSVVPREMSPSWPAAALQAQAVCARTYVLARSNPRRAYDLVPSELDQVYLGMSTESAAGRAAVDATGGQVLSYRGAFAEVMYSSCCGGHTEASSDAWGGVPFAYLAGVPCRYCTDSPNYRWQRTLEFSAVASAFARELATYGNLQAIRIAEVDASGRAKTLELAGTSGSAFVRGTLLRARIGTRAIPSLLVSKIDASAEAPERVSLEGGGLGHGVGLCQWGARGYALGGGSLHDILSLYFPGTDVTNDTGR